MTLAPAVTDTDVLLELDQRVDAAEGEGIMARWEFGRELLKKRKGKQLPHGLLDALAERTGKSRRELQHRVQFAARYGTEEEVRNVLHTLGSWHDIVNDVLPEKQAPPSVTDPRDAPPIPVGQYRVIEADPPWDVPSGPKGPGYQYALMPTDDICAMGGQVAGLAAEDAHLYLWATNTMLPDAFRVLEAWGFQYRTILTWVKPRIGLGAHFRTTTEHVLFGTRGKLDTLVNDQPTHFELPAGRHSEKPKGFYEIVERCSPGPFVRLFARDQRDGWVSWGAEA